MHLHSNMSILCIIWYHFLQSTYITLHYYKTEIKISWPQLPCHLSSKNFTHTLNPKTCIWRKRWKNKSKGLKIKFNYGKQIPQFTTVTELQNTSSTGTQLLAWLKSWRCNKSIPWSNKSDLKRPTGDTAVVSGRQGLLLGTSMYVGHVGCFP
jgi:hypothetical protein